MEDNLFPMESKKLFVKFRSEDLGEIEYDECKELLRFFDKYVFHTVGSRELLKYLEAKPGDTLLDRLTVSDIAYTFLVYESSEPVWDESFRNRHSGGYDKTAIPLYHCKRGTKLKEYTDGWTAKGCEYFAELKAMVLGWKKNDAFWSSVKKHWMEYAKENHKWIQVGKKTGDDNSEDFDDREVEVEMLDLSDEE